MTSFINEQLALKASLMAGFVVAIDKIGLQNPDLNSSLLFGASAGAGVYIADAIAANIPANFKIAGLDGYLLETRLLEIAGVAGTAYFTDKIIIGNNFYENNSMQKIGTLVLADIASTYAADYLAGKPLSFFSS